MNNNKTLAGSFARATGYATWKNKCGKETYMGKLTKKFNIPGTKEYLENLKWLEKYEDWKATQAGKPIEVEKPKPEPIKVVLDLPIGTPVVLDRGDGHTEASIIGYLPNMGRYKLKARFLNINLVALPSEIKRIK